MPPEGRKYTDELPSMDLHASAGLFGNRTHSSAPVSLPARGPDHGIRAGQADCRRQERVVERAVPVAAGERPAVAAANHPDGGCGPGWRDPHPRQAREQGSADLLPRHGARPLPRPGASGRRRDHRSHRQAPAQPHGRARRPRHGQRQGRHQRHDDLRAWAPNKTPETLLRSPSKTPAGDSFSAPTRKFAPAAAAASSSSSRCRIPRRRSSRS